MDTTTWSNGCFEFYDNDLEGITTTLIASDIDGTNNGLYQTKKTNVSIDYSTYICIIMIEEE